MSQRLTDEDLDALDRKIDNNAHRDRVEVRVDHLAALVAEVRAVRTSRQPVRGEADTFPRAPRDAVERDACSVMRGHDKWCPSTCPTDINIGCTRGKGHRGDHAGFAVGATHLVGARWPSESTRLRQRGDGSGDNTKGDSNGK
jgi:hypothetical protein